MKGNKKEFLLLLKILSTEMERETEQAIARNKFLELPK